MNKKEVLDCVSVLTNKESVSRISGLTIWFNLVISFRFHFFKLLVFFCHAMWWPVHGLSYKAEGEDRYDLPQGAIPCKLKSPSTRYMIGCIDFKSHRYSIMLMRVYL